MVEMAVESGIKWKNDDLKMQKMIGKLAVPCSVRWTAVTVLYDAMRYTPLL